MPNRDLLRAWVEEMRGSGNRLAALAAQGAAALESDPDAYAVAEHHLRRMLEAMLDICRHLAAKHGWGTPRTYYEAASLFVSHSGMAQQAEFMRLAVQMRNRLVHRYWDVPPAEMFEFLATYLPHFQTFAEYVVRTYSL